MSRSARIPVTLPTLALAASVLVAGVAAGQTPPSELVVASIRGSTDARVGEVVLREAYARLGVEVTFRSFDGAAALEASSTGEVDGELQRIDGIERQFPDLVQVPIPINYLQGTAFSIRYDFPATGWRSLQTYRIGIVRGIIFAAQGTEGMEVTVADTYDELFGLLEQGRIDVAVTPRINGLEAVLKRPVGPSGPIVEMEGVLETLFLYHYLHRRHADLVPELSRVLKEMLLDGTIRRIRDDLYAELSEGS